MKVNKPINNTLCWTCWRSPSDLRGCPRVNSIRTVRGRVREDQVPGAVVVGQKLKVPWGNPIYYAVKECPLYISDDDHKSIAKAARECDYSESDIKEMLKHCSTGVKDIDEEEEEEDDEWWNW